MSTEADPVTVAEPSPGRVLWPMLPGVLLGGLLLIVVATRWQPTQPPIDELRAILDEPNGVVRGKGLAAFQARLRTEPNLAADPVIALELLSRMDRVLAQSTPREEAYFRDLPNLSDAEAQRRRGLLLGDRDYLRELLATLPCTLLPVGLPLLQSLATETPAVDPVALAYRRRDALRALALQGESLQRWQQLSPEDLTTVVESLGQMPASGGVAEGVLAAKVYLLSLPSGPPDLPGLDKTLAACAIARDPTLREGAAFCSRYWTGNASQNASIERMLLTLMDDDGAGEELRIQLQIQPAQPPQDPAPVPIQARPGFLVRSQAVLALAWRGSAQLSLEHLRALLDLEYLKTMLLVESGGKREPNESQILDLLQAALDASVQLHRKAPTRDLTLLMPAIELLAANRNAAIQKPAEVARLALVEKANP